MIIEKPCRLYKKKLEIGVGYHDLSTDKKSNIYLNPAEIEEIVLTRPSSVSTEIFKLNPEISVLIFNRGKPTHTIISMESLPKIFKNEKLFNELTNYKKRKLMWVFCKAVCSQRIKILSRLNETRKSKVITSFLESMRELDRKLINAKSREELMGLEGNIAKRFYKSLAELNPLFNIVRNRESNDLMNVLMNYSHTILRNKVNYRIIINGLNPYHSFLHVSDGIKPSLSFDFSEFWIAYTDKLMFYALDKGVIKKRDITEEGRINMNATKKIISLINKRIPSEEIDKKIKEFISYIGGNGRFSFKTAKIKK